MKCSGAKSPLSCSVVSRRGRDTSKGHMAHSIVRKILLLNLKPPPRTPRTPLGPSVIFDDASPHHLRPHSAPQCFARDTGRDTGSTGREQGALGGIVLLLVLGSKRDTGRKLPTTLQRAAAPNVISEEEEVPPVPSSPPPQKRGSYKKKWNLN